MAVFDFKILLSMAEKFLWRVCLSDIIEVDFMDSIDVNNEDVDANLCPYQEPAITNYYLFN